MTDEQTPSLKDVLQAIGQLRTDLVGAIDGVQGEIGEVRGEISHLRTDMMARLDRQQNDLTAIRDDIAVNFARADRAVDAVKSLRSEVDHLGGEISLIERQVQRLQSEMRQLRGEP